MGSQALTNPEFMAVLGHQGFSYQATGPANQLLVGYWVDQIASVSLGTSTAKTKLGGTQVQGTGADYLLPTAARAIIAVRPKINSTTPTAAQAFFSTLKVESADLGMKDYEVFANAIDSILGTTAVQFLDPAPWYPLMQPCNGGEKVQFYGTAQVANAVAPVMGVDVILSDTWPEGFSGTSTGWGSGYGPVQSKIAGINYGGGPTATGTAAASVGTDGGVTIAGPRRRLIGLFAQLVGTTPAASKPFSGQISISASEMPISPQRFNIEPIPGFLGTTTAGTTNHIAKVAPLNLALRAPSTPKASFTLDIAVTTAGNFEAGYMYIDNP